MIRIISDTPRNKGSLFENLIKETLQRLGFDDVRLRCRRIGAEYDLEAKNTITGQKIIGECKALESPLTSEHLLKWLGKYTLRLSEQPDCAALFFTLSPLGSEAKSLYEQIQRSFPSFVVHESTDIIEILEDKGIVISSEVLEERIKNRSATIELGSNFLLYTDEGLFWAQMILQNGVATSITLANSDGNFIPKDVAKTILSKNLELDEKVYIDFSTDITRHPSLKMRQSRIVKPAKGAGWFDYRYPAPPDYFVGRYEEANRLMDYLTQVQKNQTGCRGLVIHGPSGIGKTSFVLKLEDLVKRENCFFIAVDCRACAGLDFLPLIVNTLKEIISKSTKLSKTLKDRLFKTETFRNGLFTSLDEVDIVLRDTSSIAFIILDQFEYLVQHPRVVEQIKNLLLHLTSQQSKIILGFAVRSDLAIDFPDFPFDAWSIMKEQSLSIKMKELSQNDVDQLIEELEKELGLKLKSTFISEIIGFSNNKPWILKRVCFHLLQAQKMSKLDETVETGLKLDQLFQEDLDKLSENEITIVKAIARGGATHINDLETPFKTEHAQSIVSNLVAKRLLIRIGHRYDLYHEQFARYITERFLAHEEQIQAQIDLYVRMLKVLVNEKNFEAIYSLLNSLHRLYVKEKTAYRIEHVVELLDRVQMIEPLGYKYNELSARALAKMQLPEEAKMEYEKAINSLMEETQEETPYGIFRRRLSSLSRTHLGFESETEAIEEIRRIKFDSGNLDGAKQASALNELLSREYHTGSALFKELGKLAPTITDETIFHLIGEMMHTDTKELRNFIKSLSKSAPDTIALTLTTIIPSSSMAGFVQGLLSKESFRELLNQFEYIIKDPRKTWSIRSNASEWLVNLDAGRFLKLSTQKDVNPLVLKHLRNVKNIPKKSINFIVNLFLSLPPKKASDREIEMVMYDFVHIWDKVVPCFSKADINKIMDHLFRLSNIKKPSLRWFVALFIEGLIDHRNDAPSGKTANLLLQIAKSEKATVRRRTAEIIGKATCSLKFQPDVRNKLTKQLSQLSEKDEDVYVIRAARNSLRIANAQANGS